MDDPTMSHPTEASLPPWATVLAVVAHPDDESFGLGAVLDGFVRAGATVSVLCLTRGEASTLGPSPDLTAMRAMELRDAAHHLGIEAAVLRDYPDGALSEVDPERLSAEVQRAVEEHEVEGMVVFDPSGVSGHPDHVAASRAALQAADRAALPVLGWTIPHPVAAQLNEECETGFLGHEDPDLDLVVDVDRERQRIASLAHASQAVPTSVLWRRLELLGDREYLRWLRR